MTDTQDTSLIDLDADADADIDTNLDLELFDDEISPDEERTSPERACGDPAAHDRLLAILRRHHPAGHDDIAETGRRPPRWQATRFDVSLTGCSAGLCADAA